MIKYSDIPILCMMPLFHFTLFQFRKYTDQDITKNFAHDDIVITAGRASLAFVLLLSFPLLIVPCRQTLNKVSFLDNICISYMLHV